MTAKTFEDFGIRILPTDAARGPEVDVICPRCSPTRSKRFDRCLSVNLSKGVWDCKHCGWAGGLGGGEHTASSAVAPSAPREYRRPEATPSSSTLSAGALQWFADRGIPEDVVRRNRIGLTTRYFAQTGGEAVALTFPFFRNGELVNIKYRTLDKSFQSEKDCERILFGLDDIEGADHVIIVEGEMDKLAVEAAGYTNCVSVPDGAPTPDTKHYATKLAYLDEAVAAERLAAAKTITLAVDGDAPGERLKEELARRLGRSRVRLVTWPDGCKDANDVVKASGASALRAVLDHAAAFPIDGVLSPSDLRERLSSLYSHGLPGGRSTGLASLDRGYTVKPGQLTIWTGVPGSGKSELLDQIIVNLSDQYQRDDPWRFAIYSPENHPTERHLAKLISKRTAKPFGDAAGKAGNRLDRMTERERDQAAAELEGSVFFLNPDEPHLDTIIELATALVARNGINGLIIDPWNEVIHDRAGTQSETEYISVSLSKLRRFARLHDVHVWVVAHPSKLYKKPDGTYPVPTPYDISGSAHWFNKADNCVTVWRDKENAGAPVVVHVQKVRFRECGALGEYNLFYDWRNGCYYDEPWDTDNGIRPPLHLVAS